jgi:hypothetical protein
MELGGTEKRIQALFCELSLEDRTHVPRFEQLWTRVEKTSPAPLFRRSWVVTAAIVVIAAASSFALWSRQSQTVLNIAPLELPTPASPQLNQVASVIESARPHQARKKRIVRQRLSDTVFSEAALLSRWQSPTQNFMQSPSSVSFNSLPQLNQSAKDLESFLPKNNEPIKESNQ